MGVVPIRSFVFYVVIYFNSLLKKTTSFTSNFIICTGSFRIALFMNLIISGFVSLISAFASSILILALSSSNRDSSSSRQNKNEKKWIKNSLWRIESVHRNICYFIWFCVILNVPIWKWVDKVKEVTLKESDVGLKVFVNGEPDLKELPADELKVFVTALEILIEKRFNSYIKRRR